MFTNIFVNLHGKDLEKTKQFWKSLGFKFNPQFTDEKAACLILGPNMYAMLLVEKFFTSFTKRALPDLPKTAEVITSLSVDHRPDVDILADKALKAGATNYSDSQDLGFMYTRSFQDLDGHLWEIGWMDPAHIQ